MTRLGWLDCSGGAAGDMLLGALLGAGVALEEVRAAVGALGVPVEVRATRAESGGLAAWRVEVTSAEPAPPRRTWREVRALLDRAALDARVRALAHDAFARLAEAEGAVHGVAAEDVHFHEVGAHDALADVVGCAAGTVALGLDTLVVSPVALGGGTARSAHGRIPVPVPAVLELARAAAMPVHGGPADVELCTPTGAALLAAFATSYGPMPPMTVTAVGVGAGRRELPGRPNVVRLVLGEATETGAEIGEEGGEGAGEDGLLLETNVDDLDPRLWPGVLAALLAAGASDAWLAPILMKKGRPAHTLSVLVDPSGAAAVRRVVFEQTTTLGVRESPVARRTLERRFVHVDVDGRAVAVKLGVLGGRVVNAQPEYDDVARAAHALGRPAKAVLAAAVAAAQTAGSETPGG